MITFLFLCWIFGIIQSIFEFIFHPIRTISGLFIFKLFLYVFAFCIALMIFTLFIAIGIWVVIALLVWDLFKILLNKKRTD